jgi:drug/metabolite transporter (DMT)-like permease
MSTRGWLAFAALGAIWGVPYFFIKLAVQEISPLVVAWSRLALAAAVLLPIAWHRGALKGLRAHSGAIFAFAIIEFVIPFTAISVGERWIDSSVAGILIAAVPLTIAVISRYFGQHEPLGLWRLVGLVVGLFGVITLLGFGGIHGLYGWAGAGCMLLATVGYAVGPLIIQRHLAGLDAIGPVAASQATASLVLLVPALLVWPRQAPTATTWISIAVLGLVCSAVAMLLMFYLVLHAGPSRASVITYINPMVATLLGVLFLDERLGLGGYLSLALILLGSWLATRGSRSKAAQPQTEPV